MTSPSPIEVSMRCRTCSALGPVAVEDLVVGAAVEDQVQLPCEVDRVAQA
jgi:hypothetical protein